ncbi:unnamed protein product [Calicophoron daubneyi]|uniref:MutS-like protein 5 n=1 Tax=Calicophoron daubneyi TaxID=300641 RepID=A0AAV2TRW2_CALDB
MTEKHAFLRSLFPTDSQQIVKAIGGLLSYLKIFSQFTSFEASGCIFGVFDIQLHNSEDAIFVDPSFFSNLQIFPPDYQVDTSWKRRPLLPRSIKETYVYSLFDHCRTYLGKRIMSQWIRNPIQNLVIIRQRLDAVEFLVKTSNINLLETIRTILSYVGNLPRIFRRMQQSAALPSDWKILLQTFRSLEELTRICYPHEAKLYPVQQIKKENINLGILSDAQTWIVRIVDLEATNKQQRFAVKSGLDERLDEWVQIYRCLPELLSQLAEDELKKLRENISTCGLIYFPLVGYLLKVPRAEVETPDIELCGLEYAFSHSDMAYYRNITTKELDRRYGDMMYSIIDSETTIMHRLQNEILLHSKDLLRIHQLSAEMDSLCAYAQAAVIMNGTRPKFADDPQIRITEGWHPIHQLKSNHAVRNSFHSGNDLRLTIVTGPNASGKSVYLKQIGLIVYLAYIGSFVPAEKAIVGPIDAIYTLTCADDQKDSGQSAYMICLDLASMAVRNATSKSLILLDEYAQCIEKEEVAALTVSLTEYLLARECCPHIILTTHNHEIIRKLRMHPRIGFLTMKTSTIRGLRIYFYEAERGISENSHALDAADFAGIPRKVLQTARQVRLVKAHRFICRS